MGSVRNQEVRQEYDQARLRELILYIAERLKDDPNFGKTKLVKVLFYSDFDAYRETGQPITGTPYLHMERGPYPDGFETMLLILAVTDAIMIERRFVPYRQERVIP